MVVKIAGLLVELIAGIMLATRNTSGEATIVLTVIVFLFGVVEGGFSLMRLIV